MAAAAAAAPQQRIFTSVPAVPRQPPTLATSLATAGAAARLQQSAQAPSASRFAVVRRRRPPRPPAAVLAQRRQQLLSSGANAGSASRSKPRLAADAGHPADRSSSSPSIFQTSDGRFFLISNARQEFRDGQFFQTQDGRTFRISAMEGSETVRAAAQGERAPESPSASVEKEEKGERRLALILDKIRSRAKAEKAKEEAAVAATAAAAAAAVGEVQGASSRSAGGHGLQVTPATAAAAGGSPAPGRARPSPPPSNEAGRNEAGTPSSGLGRGLSQTVAGAPSIFRTSDGKFFVISSSGSEFDEEQYFQTPDGRLFRISAMNENAEAPDALDLEGLDPSLNDVGSDVGSDVDDPFAVADALRSNATPLPGYGAGKVTSVTSSVSSLVSTGLVSSGAHEEVVEDNAVADGGEEDDDDAVIVASRGDSNSGTASATSGDTPVFIQSTPLFSSNLGRGIPTDEQRAQNHLLIRTKNGNGLIIPQQLVLRTLTHSELRGLLGLQEQQQLQQRGVLLFDSSGSAFHLEI